MSFCVRRLPLELASAYGLKEDSGWSIALTCLWRLAGRFQARNTWIKPKKIFDERVRGNFVGIKLLAMLVSGTNSDWKRVVAAQDPGR